MPADSYPLGFHVDHIIPRQHGGLTQLDNLALACLHCNRHKGPNLAGLDPLDGAWFHSLIPAETCGQNTSNGKGQNWPARLQLDAAPFAFSRSTPPIFELFENG